MNIYIGNLSPQATEEDLRHAFEGFGQVTSATIIRDKTTGRSRGFGFVEMLKKAEADAAISGLNGKKTSLFPVLASTLKSVMLSISSSARGIVSIPAMLVAAFG